MNYQYSYLIGIIFPLLVWSLIFILRKDLRREIKFVSIFSGVLAPLIALIHLRDWWKPSTITHTIVGIEDFLYAFTIAGISAGIYSFVFNKKFKETQTNNKSVLIISISALIIFISSSILFNSIIGFCIMSILTTGTIVTLRKDLLKYSLISGLLVMLIGIPSYFIIEAITPGWIANTWQFNNLTNIIIFKIPLEEYIWHFLGGTNASLIYKFWKGSKEEK